MEILGAKSMQNYRKVLVGVDGSKQASHAFERAISIARRNDATLVIASVLNADKYVGVGMAIGAVHVNQMVEEDLLGNMEAQNEPLVAQARAAGIANVILDVSAGNAKTALAEGLVEKYDIDLIVVGATGTSVLERMLIGSTTNYVIRNAPVDVLVARD